MEGRAGGIVSVAFSADGRFVAAATLAGAIPLWDVTTGEPLAHLRGHQGRVRSVAFSPDGTLLASAGVDGTVRLWDLARLVGTRDTGAVPDTIDAMYQELMRIFQRELPVTLLFPPTETYSVRRRIGALEGVYWPDPVQHRDHLSVEEQGARQ